MDPGLDGSMVMPGRFIDVFERNGFVTKVDLPFWIRYWNICRMLWRREKKWWLISRNFSRRHNEYTDFVPNILKRLKDYKVPSELWKWK